MKERLFHPYTDAACDIISSGYSWWRCKVTEWRLVYLFVNLSNSYTNSRIPVQLNKTTSGKQKGWHPNERKSARTWTHDASDHQPWEDVDKWNGLRRFVLCNYVITSEPSQPTRPLTSSTEPSPFFKSNKMKKVKGMGFTKRQLVVIAGKHSSGQKIKAFKNPQMSALDELITEGLLLINDSVRPLNGYLQSFRHMRQHKSSPLALWLLRLRFYQGGERHDGVFRKMIR